MKTPKVLNNQKGFSLVELMVVVAIIGILAVIGIPQYQKFMAKARQAEAKTHLNAIFQGETSFFTEYNGYTVSMANIGAGAVGQQLRYNAGFALLNGCTGSPVVGAPPENKGTADDTNDFTDLLINNGVATWTYFTPGTENDAGVNGASASACSSTARTYQATAWGNPTNSNGVAPNNAANNLDRFTMQQNRLLTQTSVGL